MAVQKGKLVSRMYRGLCCIVPVRLCLVNKSEIYRPPSPTETDLRGRAAIAVGGPAATQTNARSVEVRFCIRTWLSQGIPGRESYRAVVGLDAIQMHGNRSRARLAQAVIVTNALLSYFVDASYLWGNPRYL